MFVYFNRCHCVFEEFLKESHGFILSFMIVFFDLVQLLIATTSTNVINYDREYMNTRMSKNVFFFLLKMHIISIIYVIKIEIESSLSCENPLQIFI